MRHRTDSPGPCESRLVQCCLPRAVGGVVGPCHPQISSCYWGLHPVVQPSRAAETSCCWAGLLGIEPQTGAAVGQAAGDGLSARQGGCCGGGPQGAPQERTAPHPLPLPSRGVTALSFEPWTSAGAPQAELGGAPAHATQALCICKVCRTALESHEGCRNTKLNTYVAHTHNF